MSGVRSPKRKGFPDNLYMDSAGYFSYRNPQSGKRKGMGKDRAVAFREARLANAALAALVYSPLAEWVTGTAQQSLADWVSIYREKWIANMAPAPATIKNADGHLRRIKEATFSWMGLKDITTVHAAKFLEDVERESGEGAATNIRSRLSDVFRMAENQGLIEAGKNPVTATYNPKREVKRSRLSLEQFLTIRQHAPTWLRNAMNLALLTAQRREDVAVAKFSDERDGYVYVVQSKSGGKVRLQLDATIRLAAVDMSIGEVVKQCRDNVLSSFMVHHLVSRATAKAGDAVSLNGLSAAFKVAVRAAGITAEAGRTPPSFHEIRSLSERLYREQYGAEFAQAILGHRTAKMTSTYDDLRGSGWRLIAVK